MSDYQSIAKEARKKVAELIWKAQTSHIGSNFSCIDIMTVLFEKMFNWNKDKFILSAGWKAASLYYFLWKAGRITKEELDSYCQEGSKWIGLSEPIHPDIPFAGGSMGMGLPAAVGFALSKKMKKEDGKVYVLMSDGELQCGTTWESALIAAHHKLDNLVVIIDNNGLQAMGEVRKIVKVEPLKKKWECFGWSTIETNGHVYQEIEDSILGGRRDGVQKICGVFVETGDICYVDMPIVIFAKTIKGRGVSFMENNNLYHYLHLSDEDYYRALEELNI